MKEAMDQLSQAAMSQASLRKKKNGMELKEDGTPVVYTRRWFILAAYSMGYFLWNFHSFRQSPLAPEYAKYFDTTNEFSPPELGIDFMILMDNLLLLFFYPLAGYLVDTYGLLALSAGCVLQAVTNWWWFLSFDNYPSVLVARGFSDLAGAMIAVALLKVSMLWFPKTERAIAVAVGTLFSTLGASATLIVFPFFKQSLPFVDFSLKSCTEEFQTSEDAIGLNGTCTDEAEAAFCCVSDVDIDFVNMFCAILTTICAIFAVIVVRNAPATPPSKSGHVMKAPSWKQAMSLMFSNKNYTQICVADFIASGPPIVLFSTIARIFPPEISGLSTILAGISVLCSIPAAGIFSKMLARTLKFYEYTSRGYILGFVCWLGATICFLSGVTVLLFFILFFVFVALQCYVLWTVSVYELKLEYVFDREVSLQGFVVAVDRVIINLSSLIFLATIPPERYTGPGLTGQQFVFVVGAFCMGLGAFLAYTVPNKREYKRLKYELEDDDEEELNKKVLEEPVPVKAVVEEADTEERKESL